MACPYAKNGYVYPLCMFSHASKGGVGCLTSKRKMTVNSSFELHCPVSWMISPTSKYTRFVFDVDCTKLWKDQHL